MYHENQMLNKETQNLRTRVKAMQETIDVLTAKNAQLLAERETGNWIGSGDDEGNKDITTMIAKYMSEIEELIDMAKQELEKKQEKVRRTSNQTKNNSDAQETEKEADEGKEADDEYDGDDNEDEDSDTDTESEVKAITNELNEELVELTSEISLKQKLIEELETSQKRLHIMKQQYETKLLALEARITSTQEERDKVLKYIASKPGGDSAEKTNRIKQDYQEKLTKLQGEVKKLKTAQKEHSKLLRNQAQYERQ